MVILEGRAGSQVGTPRRGVRVSRRDAPGTRRFLSCSRLPLLFTLHFAFCLGLYHNHPVKQSIVALDLEGVLVPEIWISVAEKTHIPELRRTTRDEPDYDKLMRARIQILDQHGLKPADIRSEEHTSELQSL